MFYGQGNKAGGGFKDNVETLTDSTYNGKPLYRRVIKAKTPASGQTIFSFSGINVEQVFIDEGHSSHLLTNGNKVPLDFFLTTE